MKKIVLTGGGTAGHCLPNIALVPALKNSGFEIFYIGSYNGIERTIAEKNGLSYYGISSGKLRRYFDLKNLSDPFRVIKGYFESEKLLKQIRPDVVFSKGGYVSVPVVKAAKKLGIPAVIHESDITPGLANRLSFSSAKKICCSFKKTLDLLPAQKAVFTGTPIRRALLSGNRDRALCYTDMVSDGKPFLMVIGGSLGAQSVNEAVRSALPELLERYNVIHLCGRGKTDPGYDRMAGYRQYEYIDDELPDLYALSDIVISRAGANAVFELLALKKPNILIPLPGKSSRGDQLLNAKAFEDASYSFLLPQEEVTKESLISAVDEVYEKRETYIQAMEKAPEQDAVEKICNIIKEMSL
ncbi:MAG: undecaprenyldiphospho-muramoylpentapeptide beta-N-acetylglucosaminyltransferase [Lachnospiraceae bacterium]|nr:undecaprenyldiphospho-muramoylpentapeptide beta-N-acetylglucosaminyltransferase [Lachnospiraceae bacterium]